MDIYRNTKSLWWILGIFFLISGLLQTGCKKDKDSEPTVKEQQTNSVVTSTPDEVVLQAVKKSEDGGIQSPVKGIPGLTRDPGWLEAKIAKKMERARTGKSGKNPEDPKARLEERNRDRIGEDGAYTFKDILRAKAQIESMVNIRKRAKSVYSWNWEWLGPGNIGGRVRSIVIHPTSPNKMWVGSVAGGIWHTTNGGSSWAPVDNFLPSLAISTMIIDPSNPDILYAGTGEGFGSSGYAHTKGAGIFKSIDGGRTWDQLPSTAPDFSGSLSSFDKSGIINRLTINPNYGQRLLAATDTSSSSPHGLYISNDGGQHWDPISNVRQQVMDVKFSPNQDDRVVAGLSDGGILWSSDGGITWLPSLLNGTLFTTELREDACDGDDTIIVKSTAGLASGDRIQIGSGSSPQTVTISKVVDGNKIELNSDLNRDFYKDDKIENLRKGRVELAWSSSCVVYASMNVGGGALWKSNDCGETFSLINNTADTPGYFFSNFWGIEDQNHSQGNYDNALWVDPTNSNFLVIGGVDLWRSKDGGHSLEKISNWTGYHLGISAHADQHFIIHHPQYNGEDFNQLYFANDGGIQMVSNIKAPVLLDFSDAWTNLANNLGITQFYAGAASPNGDIIGGAQDNGILKLSADSGPQEWYQCAECTGDGGFCAINPVNDNIFYATIQFLNVLRSVTWGTVYLPANIGLGDSEDREKARFVAPLVMDPSDSDVLVAGGTSIWRTDNSALFWGSIRSPRPNSPKCSAIAIGSGQEGRIWVGYESGLVSVTTTDVTHWVDVDDNGSNHLPNDRTVTDIAINSNNCKEVFVTFGGYSDRSIWYTYNEGSNWQNRTSNLPQVHINTITFNPYDSAWVFVGSDLGMFYSNDKGLTWNIMIGYGANGSPYLTEVVDLFWQKGYLIAATHGRGMFHVKPPTSIYVDKNYTGIIEIGSEAHPFRTIKKAIQFASHGTDIRIKTGDYYESSTGKIRFYKRGSVIATHGLVKIR